MRDCDKCGRFVPSNNDAVELGLIMYPGSMFIIFAHSRHLLSTLHCEGSPSRAQYIEGQPRDDRGYGYNLELETKIREAYAQMQSSS